MLIVLEGCDGTGKTTLADLLLETHQGSSEIIHKGPIKRHPLQEYEWDLRGYDRTRLDHLVVCDRWHVGELVYGPLYRGRSTMTGAQQRHIEMFLQSRGAVRMVVDALPATIIRRLRDRGEDLLEESHVGLVYDFYRDYAEHNGWDLIKSHDDVEPIIERSHVAQEEVFQLELLKSYVGPTRPDVLIAGDHPPSLANGIGLTTAFAPHQGSIGSWVMHAIKDIPNVGLLNTAVDPNLDVAMNVLRFPRLITLGAHARQLADRQKISQRSFPHPRDFVRNGVPFAEGFIERLKEAASC